MKEQEPYYYKIDEPVLTYWEGTWQEGKIINGYRTRDGIVHVQLLDGMKIGFGEARHEEYLKPIDNDGAPASSEMTSTEKLAVINSMRIVDADISNGELIYAVVDYNEENIESLAKVVPNVEEYIQTVGDPDGTKESIDISTAAFQYAGADCYVKGKFRNDESDYTKIEVLEAENEKLSAELAQVKKERDAWKREAESWKLDD